MTRVGAGIAVPGSPPEAHALWTDPRRWPSFVEGLAAVHKVDPDWPRSGRAVWTSGPSGRGRVAETVVAHDPGAAHVVEVEDERLRGTQTVTFAALPGGGVQVRIELDYALKDRRPLMWLTNVLFVRRSQRDALQRTLRRFATERAGDVSLG